MAAARAAPIRVGNLRQMPKYSRACGERTRTTATSGPGREIPVPGLADAESRVAVPAMALGSSSACSMVESDRAGGVHDADEAILTVVASLVANAIEIDRVRERE